MFVGSLFRRAPDPHRESNLERPLLDVQGQMQSWGLSEAELLEASVSPVSWRQPLPYIWTERMGISGVYSDPLLAFSAHLASLPSRVRIRRSVLARLSRSNWGLETGVLRSTHSALLVSLAGCGLVTVGSSMYEGGFRQRDTRRINIAARLVVELGVSARIEALFSAADFLTPANSYLRSCAVQLDRALRAHNCSLQRRMYTWLCNTFNVRSWAPSPTSVTLSSVRSSRMGGSGNCGI